MSGKVRANITPAESDSVVRLECSAAVSVPALWAGSHRLLSAHSDNSQTAQPYQLDLQDRARAQLLSLTRLNLSGRDLLTGGSGAHS